MTAIVEEILAGEKRATGTADLMLQMAEWAAAAFARFDRALVAAGFEALVLELGAPGPRLA